MRTVITIIAVFFAIAILAVWLWPVGEPKKFVAPIALDLPQNCVDTAFEGDVFLVCTFDPTKAEIEMRLRADDGRPIERLERVAASPGMIFAMNGGMYHEDLSPVGLYVEDGNVLSPLNQSDGKGNFFMKPNGVFFVDSEGGPHVLETTAFSQRQSQVRYATQSGPMLVIDGQFHPRFEPDGASRYVRNEWA